MLVAMKPNAPNQLNQFDRATVNRPLMRARLGACRGGELRPHHFHDHGARPIVPCRVIRRMTLILKPANKGRLGAQSTGAQTISMYQRPTAVSVAYSCRHNHPLTAIGCGQSVHATIRARSTVAAIARHARKR